MVTCVTRAKYCLMSLVHMKCSFMHKCQFGGSVGNLCSTSFYLIGYWDCFCLKSSFKQQIASLALFLCKNQSSSPNRISVYLSRWHDLVSMYFLEKEDNQTVTDILWELKKSKVRYNHPDSHRHNLIYFGFIQLETVKRWQLSIYYRATQYYESPP